MSPSERIRQRLYQQGALPFAEFMHQALYAPDFGYYNSGLQKTGPNGDFITAPELTPLFGQTLANQCQQILVTLNNPIIFEFGAGSGQLCVDILTHLEHLNCLPHEYRILDVSGNFCYRQKELVTRKIPHLADKIQWLSSWPQERFNGVIIANEVLDAMPVHRFLQSETGLLESYITLNAQGELDEVFRQCNNPRLLAHVQSVLPNNLFPYQSEANLFIDDWLYQCHAMLNQGVLFILDYGFPCHEYYHSDRCNGTLMCHYRHLAHTNPLLYFGEQDITAHVNFTHVAEAAQASGFHVAGFTNQASFLLANGLLSLLSESENGREQEQVNRCQAVKQLVQPSEMGELFKVIALTKQIELMLNGFQLNDKRASL